MSDLLQKIKAGTNNTKIIDWPGDESLKIELRVLSGQDHLDSSLAADKIFDGTKVGIENIDNYSAELEIQLLFRAIMDPETNEQLFKNITDFRSSISPEVQDILGERLDALHEECSPDPMKMNDGEFDKLTADLKKNPKTTAGSISNIYTARKLIIFLEKQLQNLQPANGSIST